MSAVPHGRRPGLLAAALAKADEFFFEKVAEPAPPAAIATHPRAVVVGLGPRVGATTIARALAVELASRAEGGAIVTASRLPVRTAPAARAARRIAVAFGDRDVRVSGRLCLASERSTSPGTHEPFTGVAGVAAAARYLAPFVADWPYGAPAAEALALEAPIVLVAAPATDPALAAAVAAVVPGAAVVLNRALDGWDGAADLSVPEARIHARLALAGRPVTGRFGAAIAALAERVA